MWVKWCFSLFWNTQTEQSPDVGKQFKGDVDCSSPGRIDTSTPFLEIFHVCESPKHSVLHSSYTCVERPFVVCLISFKHNVVLLLLGYFNKMNMIHWNQRGFHSHWHVLYFNALSWTSSRSSPLLMKLECLWLLIWMQKHNVSALQSWMTSHSSDANYMQMCSVMHVFIGHAEWWLGVWE